MRGPSVSDRQHTSADALRRAFDREFAASPGDLSSALDGYLAVLIGDDAYLLALDELSGLVVDRRIVALPTHAPHLIGVAGIRGAITPIYDLAGILGYPPVGAAARWSALTRTGARIGLAFDRFGGHIRTARASATPAGETPSGSRVRGALRIDGAVYRIVDTAVIVAEIEQNARAGLRGED